MPDPTHVFDYNRYMYARGNPLKYNDPTGHCATTEPSTSDQSAHGEWAECWQYANTIWAQWDKTDYWNQMWPEGKEHFIKNVATRPIPASYFKGEFMKYISSPAYKTWFAQQPVNQPLPALDLGDYTSVNFSAQIADFSFVRDDFGTWYFKVGGSGSIPGASITRGDLFIENDDGTSIDIDQLNISLSEKATLMQQAMPGWSQGASGGKFMLNGGFSRNADASHHITLEGGIGTPGTSVSVLPYSYTFIIPWQ